jgi:hypothetical protein
MATKPSAFKGVPKVTVLSRSPLLEVLRGSRFHEEHKKTLELLPLTRQIALWVVVEM